MPPDEKRFTDQDMKDAMRVAVLESKVDDMETVIPEVFASLKTLTASVNSIPLEIVNCKDKIDADIKAYVHKQFVTEPMLNAAELRIESKISKGYWLMSGFFTAFTIINYLIAYTKFFGGS